MTSLMPSIATVEKGARIRADSIVAVGFKVQTLKRKLERI